MIITIDGPASSGKSSIADAIGRKLNVKILHSGLIYRALAKKYKNSTLSVENLIHAGGITISDLNDQELYAEDIGKLASEISKEKVVRKFADKFQHDFAKENKDIIVEGRDAGSVVFPEADLKFFFSASAEVRASRRYKQLIKLGKESNYEELLKDIMNRDEQDQKRTLSPLTVPQGAITIDTTNMTEEEVISKVCSFLAPST